MRIGSTEILSGLTMTIADRGITALVGPSGSGKSSALRCCNRLEVASSGVIRFRGDDIMSFDPMVLRRRVGMVFQRPTPFNGTVHDNLRVADPAITDERARAALDRVALPTSLLDREARSLSGGESQRACLARTLAAGPEVLLMDEPTSSLDPQATDLLEQLARNLADDGSPIVWVSHDMAQVSRIADRVIRIDHGTARSDDGPARS
ncbi:MAG: phosphate ABC transporter ATP-binding protein [Acidimicrobiia bacterium]